MASSPRPHPRPEPVHDGAGRSSDGPGSPVLELDAAACPLCGAADATKLCAGHHLARGVPGPFPLAAASAAGCSTGTGACGSATAIWTRATSVLPTAGGVAGSSRTSRGSPGGHLLDVGCATGRFLQQMAAIGWRVSGSELDPEAAARARTLWGAGPARRGEVVRDVIRHAGPA